jgi:hypothetical protein
MAGEAQRLKSVYQTVAEKTSVPVDVVKEIGDKMVAAGQGGFYGGDDFVSRLTRRAIIRRDAQ